MPCGLGSLVGYHWLTAANIRVVPVIVWARSTPTCEEHHARCSLVEWCNSLHCSSDTLSKTVAYIVYACLHVSHPLASQPALLRVTDTLHNIPKITLRSPLFICFRHCSLPQAPKRDPSWDWGIHAQKRTPGPGWKSCSKQRSRASSSDPALPRQL